MWSCNILRRVCSIHWLIILKKRDCSLSRSLVAPGKPSAKSFEELFAIVSKHYNPVPSEVVMSFKFNSCSCLPCMSVADFVAELRHLSRHCGFLEVLWMSC